MKVKGWIERALDGACLLNRPRVSKAAEHLNSFRPTTFLEPKASDWAFLMVRGAPKAATALVGAAVGRKDLDAVFVVVQVPGLGNTCNSNRFGRCACKTVLYMRRGMKRSAYEILSLWCWVEGWPEDMPGLSKTGSVAPERDLW